MREIVLTPAQCVAARGLLSWGVRELAAKAGVSQAAIVDFEKGHRKPHKSTREMIRLALVRAGIEIAPGVALDEHSPVERVVLRDGSVISLVVER